MELHEALLRYLVGRAEARPNQALESSVLGKSSLFFFGDGHTNGYFGGKPPDRIGFHYYPENMRMREEYPRPFLSGSLS